MRNDFAQIMSKYNANKKISFQNEIVKVFLVKILIIFYDDDLYHYFFFQIYIVHIEIYYKILFCKSFVDLTFKI